jgi:nucleoside-diphosphate-sugar epimerase
MWRDKRILIFGGSGYVGQALTQLLYKKNYTQIVSTSRQKINQKYKGIKYVSGIDITRSETIEPLISKAEIVINLAGFISFSQKDRKKLLTVNVEGVKNILRACQKNKSLDRLIHISSTASFGFSDKEITEQTHFDWSRYKNLVYSYSKFLANDLLHQSLVPTNILYPALILGPEDRTSTQNLFDYAREKQNLLVPPGSNSFIDVRDVVSAIELILQSAVSKENYILSTKSFSFEQIFSHVVRALNQKTRIQKLPTWSKKIIPQMANFLEFLGWNKVSYEQLFLGFQHRRHKNQKLIHLGFQPRYSLNQTLCDFWKQNMV